MSAAGHLAYSLHGAAGRVPTDGGQLAAMPSEDLVRLDVLAMRFSRCQDLAAAVLRAIGAASDVQAANFPQLLDALRRQGLAVSPDDWALLRAARNAVAHDYPSGSGELVDPYQSIVDLAPLLLRDAGILYDHVTGTLGLDPAALGPRPA